MTVPYIRPGISVREVTNPVVTPLAGEATSVCIIGPAQGFQEFVETIVLDDKTPVFLSGKYPDLDTLSVVDASNLTLDPFTPSDQDAFYDYDIDSSLLSTNGQVSIARSMQTSIPNGESVVVYLENDDPATQETSFTSHHALVGIDPISPTNRSDATENYVVMSPGLVPADQIVTAGLGTNSPTVANSGDYGLIGAFQTIYYDYYEAIQTTMTVTVNGGPSGGIFTVTFKYDGEEHTTSNLAYDVSASAFNTALETAIGNHSDLGAGNCRTSRTGTGTINDPYVYTVIFQNELATDNQMALTATSALTGGTTPSVAVAVTQEGEIGNLVRNRTIQLDDTTPVVLEGEGVDYVFKTQTSLTRPVSEANLYQEGDDNTGDYAVGGSGASMTIYRSPGSTTMNRTQNRITVRVTYRATPVEYWAPTRVYSQIDAEQKYGPAMNQQGEIVSPVSFAAAKAFEAGAPNVIIQPLFAESGTVRTTPTGAATDWESTLANLRGLLGVNLLVPLVSSGGLTTNDALISAIASKVKNHISYMKNHQKVDVSALIGSDSTVSGQGSRAQLRSLCLSLRGSNTNPDPLSEHFTVLTPSSVRTQNPVNGLEMVLGSQYAAAELAGRMASRVVSEPVTRKVLGTLRGLGEFMTEEDADTDAEAGCCVLTTDQDGRVIVRHGITVSNASVAARELNVVRAKFFHLQVMRSTLNQLIGTLIADETAGFTVQIAAIGVLERLREDGVIVGWRTPQARAMPDDPTHIVLRYEYLPAFPLNYITIEFSLNTQTGAISTGVVGA